LVGAFILRGSTVSFAIDSSVGQAARLYRQIMNFTLSGGRSDDFLILVTLKTQLLHAPSFVPSSPRQTV
jgi:hypothetical protein